MPTMEFGSLLKSLRVRAGLNQKQLAQKLGVRRSTISDWENGNHLPRHRDLVEKMVEALGGTEDDLQQLLAAAFLPQDQAQKDAALIEREIPARESLAMFPLHFGKKGIVWVIAALSLVIAICLIGVGSIAIMSLLQSGHNPVAQNELTPKAVSTHPLPTAATPTAPPASVTPTPTSTGYVVFDSSFA